MKLRPSGTRLLQLGILFLLVICSAQVLWWYVDQVRYTNAIHERMLTHYEADIRVAEQMLHSHDSSGGVEETYPHLGIDSGFVKVTRDALETLEEEKVRRLNMYRWEGSFFFLVLLACMGVLWKALHEEASLRKRQQNFVASVSHEFKSPLASLQLTAETMAMRELPPERTQELIGRFLDDIRRMEEMVSKILDATRIEQGRLPLAPERISLTGTVEKILGEFRERADEHQVELVGRLPEDLEIRADAGGVRTVIRNLVDNAIKSVAIEGGGKVTVSIERENGFIQLRVEDDGHGFRRRDSAKLFTKFYRPGDELRRRRAGTGLGLYIVERFMHLEKGKVHAHSDGPGKGAVFTVSWPVIRGESS